MQEFFQNIPQELLERLDSAFFKEYTDYGSNDYQELVNELLDEKVIAEDQLMYLEEILRDRFFGSIGHRKINNRLYKNGEDVLKSIKTSEKVVTLDMLQEMKSKTSDYFREAFQKQVAVELDNIEDMVGKYNEAFWEDVMVRVELEGVFKREPKHLSKRDWKSFEETWELYRNGLKKKKL